MAAIKPDVDGRTIRKVLRDVLGPLPVEVSPLSGGNVARAFSVVSPETESKYVLRFNEGSMDVNFEKEAFVSETFRTPLVPIPTVIAYGRTGSLHYCLSERSIGTGMDRLEPSDRDGLLPHLLETLVAIHSSDVTAYTGFGVFDGEGQGFFSDWASSQLRVAEEERTDGFFGRWHVLFDTTFLERDRFDEILRHMTELLTGVPETRYLIHGDFGFGNVLVADGRITAVIDWLNAGFGDFVYDVAWLDFWDVKRNYGEIMRPIYESRGFDVDSWYERLLCYQCRIALDGMRFFAKANDEDGYRFTTHRIAERLDPLT